MSETRGTLVHTVRIEVKWGEMDAIGHLNNVNYFRYFEHGRIDWMHRRGIATHGSGCGLMLVHAECNFRKSVVYPSTVEVRLYVNEPRRSSVPLWQEMVDAHEPNVKYADGGATLVWIDYATNKSLPLPDHMRAIVLKGQGA